MNIDHRTLMAKKSEQELRAYISQPNKYTIETMDAALEEMRSRAIIIGDDEIALVNEVRVNKKLIKQQESKAVWDKNSVIDPDAPAYYSQRAIWAFSVVFTTLAGSILLYHNLKKANQKGAALGTLLFGIGYSIILI